MSRHKLEAGQGFGQKTDQRTLQASGQGHARSCPSPLRLLVAANIAACRKKSGLTQSQTGRSLGLEKETISRIEGGKISVSVDRLEEFADLFHCDIRDLVFGVDDASADRHDEEPRSASELRALPGEREVVPSVASADRHGEDTRP